MDRCKPSKHCKLFNRLHQHRINRGAILSFRTSFETAAMVDKLALEMDVSNSTVLQGIIEQYFSETEKPVVSTPVWKGNPKGKVRHGRQ